MLENCKQHTHGKSAEPIKLRALWLVSFSSCFLNALSDALRHLGHTHLAHVLECEMMLLLL